MKRLAIIATGLLLAACQDHPFVTEVVYRDITGQNRSDYLLKSDLAACDCDVYRARLDPDANVPMWPPFYEPCMASKGWRVVSAR